jgi:HlyD family secretion protein
MEGDKVFRQAVLDRLASPEQLDSLMQVTDPRGWLALLGCAGIIVTALVWGFAGRIPTKVEASGILLYSAGMADILALGQGQISSLQVEVGDVVSKGQLIAEVAQPELAEEIKTTKARFEELKASLERDKAQAGRDVDLRKQASEEERRNLGSAAGAAAASTKELNDRLASQQRLYDKGLITKDVVDSTREALRAAQVAASSSNQQRLAADTFSTERSDELSISAETLRLQETQRQIEMLEDKFQENSKIVSTYDGRIIEIRTMVGDVVAPGKSLLSLELTGDKATIEALLYVDSREGKTIKPGMDVQLAPSIVKKERYGLLLGRVRAVETFSSTRQGMMRVLHNEQLVDAFLQETNGTPIAVRAELLPQADTPSGYKWSSGKGPDLTMTSGTRTAGWVTTRTQRPIALVFPVFESR